jgi:acyl dehydratase
MPTTTTPGWDALAVGVEAEPFVDEPLSRTDIVRYQGASGDLNPIHHDDDFARAAGYPGAFSVGMLAAGILGAYATAWFGAANLRRFKVRFRAQAWPGDVLTYRARIAALREETGDRFVDIELSATRPDGEIHVEGWATFAVPA